MNGARSGERRKWTRLPLAIPVFVRSRDEKGKEFLEFATALNVSAGGMLVAMRRAIASNRPDPTGDSQRPGGGPGVTAASIQDPTRQGSAQRPPPRATTCWASSSRVRCLLAGSPHVRRRKIASAV